MATEETTEQIIAGRRSPKIAEKLEIWKLLDDSYAGGTKYIEGKHLFRYLRESSVGYANRLKRSTYFNHVQPMVDMLIGFIFTVPPVREKITGFEYLLEKSAKRETLDQFMYRLATKSIMMTAGVLVDSPSFNPEEVLTRKDRQDRELNPYPVMYSPERIRDFSVDDKGKLNWILLDNSYVEDNNPYVNAYIVKKYRLWTPLYFQDFTEKSDSDKSGKSGREIELKAGDKIDHPVGEVPFVFVNWRDGDDDKISDTIFEDIALYDRAIYNFMSYLDEMIAGGTFKMLFYPIIDENDLPSSIKSGGVSELAVIPFDPESKQPPFFAGAGLQEISPFLAAIEMYFQEILKKVGVESSESQSVVKTGVARRYDFEKTKAYLVSGVKQLQNAEEMIFHYARKWEGIANPDIPEIKYYKDFLDEDLDSKMARFSQMLMLPYEKLRTSLHKLMVKSGLSGEIKKEELEAILKEIEIKSKEDFKAELDAGIEEARLKAMEGRANETGGDSSVN